MNDISTADQLEQLLVAEGLDITCWGAGSAKSVRELWNELVAGESEIQLNPLCRVVRGVVQVIIRKGEKVLIELEQELSDRRVRRRNHVPSEKMKPGETYQETTRRCVAEELGIELDARAIVESSYRYEETTKPSSSYPGLLTLYTFHIVEVIVPKLPDSDFWTVERGSSAGDTWRRHHWAWQRQ